ncbi:MAG TPA: hypothetical protein VJ922_00550 [Actinomycetota bacterium]|nr:hypothetical protein [Actinomycetota bacterium]
MRRSVLFALLLAALSSTFGPARAADRIGYIGCSQARDAVSGYHMVGGTKFWPALNEYGGGSVVTWARGVGSGSPYWNTFKSYLASQPPSKIWIQWCTRAGENQAENQAAAVAVLGEVRRLAPGVPVYVSAQNGYFLPHSCGISGLDGPFRMELLARQTAALPGPDVGDLKSRYQAPSIPPGHETTADGCHANNVGKTKVLGPKLKAFFG